MTLALSLFKGLLHFASAHRGPPTRGIAPEPASLKSLTSPLISEEVVRIVPNGCRCRPQAQLTHAPSPPSNLGPISALTQFASVLAEEVIQVVVGLLLHQSVEVVLGHVAQVALVGVIEHPLHLLIRQILTELLAHLKRRREKARRGE